MGYKVSCFEGNKINTGMKDKQLWFPSMRHLVNKLEPAEKVAFEKERFHKDGTIDYRRMEKLQ